MPAAERSLTHCADIGLQRYDCDVAIALQRRTLADQPLGLGLEQADTLTTASLGMASRRGGTSG